ncbi:hypothetical protein GCM10027047_33640 [Rhodococcus aerolatus]
MSRAPVVLLGCPGAPTPPPGAGTVHPVAALPTRAELAAALTDLDDGTRVVLLAGRAADGPGPDAALAAVLTALLRTERLDVELALVAPSATPGTRAWGLPRGRRALTRALDGQARAVPLVRDETGQALVGLARLTGPEGGPVTGEAYADDVLLFTGSARAVEISPTPQGEGVRAVARTGALARRRATARAVQTGSTGLEVVRDGVPAPRAVRRSTFYRHVTPWRLVR